MDDSTPKDVLERIERKVDEMRKEYREDMKELRAEVKQSNTTQVRQQSILEEHIRRTEANEKQIVLNKEYNDEQIEMIREEIKPLKTNSTMWLGAAKALVITTSIVGLISTFMKLFM